MSVRRLVATMDVSGVNVSEFCAEHGLSRDTFYRIRRRFVEEGELGLVPLSRAPRRVPNRTSFVVEDRIVELRKELVGGGLDAGAATIEWHLRQEGCSRVPSVSTIWRILKARGFVADDPSKSHRALRSFESSRANQVWQIDGTLWPLADGTEIKIVNVIDDGSRLCVASQAHPSETLDAAWSTFLAGAGRWGMPQRILADNGSAFRAMEKPLAVLGIGSGHSRPYHPQTCGKVERFHQTLKKWLEKRSSVGTLGEVQEQLGRFVKIYNFERPHRSIGRIVPAQRWNEMPKSGPANQPLNDPTRIGERKVSGNGILHIHGYAISVGSQYANTTATAIITGLTAHVFVRAELVRTLTINPDRPGQPLHPTAGRPRKQP